MIQFPCQQGRIIIPVKVNHPHRQLKGKITVGQVLASCHQYGYVIMMILSLSFGHQEIPQYQKHSTVMYSNDNNKYNVLHLYCHVSSNHRTVLCIHSATSQFLNKVNLVANLQLST
jgi:hypothetical protein